MCESMLECEELVYTTWWWIPVLEASRSSRLSVVGYTSCPAHTLKDVQKHADTLDPGPFLDLWLLQTALYPTTYCYVVTGWIWMLFCLPIVEAVRMSVLYFRAFMQAVTMTTGLLSNFPWFMPFSQKSFPLWTTTKTNIEPISISWQNVLRWWISDSPDAKRFLRWFFAVQYYHLLIAIFSLLCIFFPSAPLLQSIPVQLEHNCTCRSDLTIFILVEDSQGKGIGQCRWFAADAGQWMKGMEHVAVRAHPDFFQQTEFSLFLSLRMDGAIVICSCRCRYHTTAGAL